MTFEYTPGAEIEFRPIDRYPTRHSGYGVDASALLILSFQILRQSVVHRQEWQDAHAALPLLHKRSKSGGWRKLEIRNFIVRCISL